MFIKNHESINPQKIIWVGEKTRLFLQSKGFCETTFYDTKWGFIKTKKIVKIINNYKENGGDTNE